MLEFLKLFDFKHHFIIKIIASYWLNTYSEQKRQFRINHRQIGVSCRLSLSCTTSVVYEHWRMWQLFPFSTAIDGGISHWSDWGACNVTCGSGIQSRSRECNSPPPSGGGRNCSDPIVDHQECSVEECGKTGLPFQSTAHSWCFTAAAILFCLWSWLLMCYQMNWSDCDARFRLLFWMLSDS